MAHRNRTHLVLSRMSLVLLVAALAIFCPPLAVAVENVAWIETVNATAMGNALQKSGGSPGWNAGAASSKQISSGNGYVEFTATTPPSSDRWLAFGLSNGNMGVNHAEIDFSIQLSGFLQNPAEIWENGAYTGISTGYTVGDTFRISVESGAVKYYKNGTLWHTSALAPTYPILADASLFGINATISNAVISGTLSLRTNCGLLDDGQIHIATDYTTFTPPSKGGSYGDPVFGCTVQRLTDSLTDFGIPVHHEYASMRPFNVDNTHLLLMRDDGAFYVIDRDGSVIVQPGSFEFGGNASEPRWGRSSPSVLYYHINNQLKQTDISSGSLINSVIHTFAEYTSINIGNGESDLSDDGNHFVIVGTKPDGTQEAFLYTINTDTKGPVMNFGTTAYDYFDVTHNNQIIANWGTFGTGRFTGMELFDSNMNFVRQVLAFGAHADRGMDFNGDEIMVYEANNDGDLPCGSTSGVAKVRLTDSQKTCLLPREWTMTTHVSVNNAGGWALVSVADERNPGTSNDPLTLPPNWETMWRVYENELILVKLDGSQVRRLAHHRTRTIINGTFSYWSSPRAALSGDAKFVVFDSNYAQSTSVNNYTDVYIIFMSALQ